MKFQWKALRDRLRPGRWPAMVWVVLAMAAVTSVATVVVGRELGAVAREPLLIDTR